MQGSHGSSLSHIFRIFWNNRITRANELSLKQQHIHCTFNETHLRGEMPHLRVMTQRYAYPESLRDGVEALDVEKELGRFRTIAWGGQSVTAAHGTCGAPSINEL